MFSNRALRLRPSLGLFAAAVAATTLVLPVHGASAQTPAPDSAGLTISPPTVELDAAPGQVLTQKYTITNNSTFERDIIPTVQNFDAKNEGGDPNLTSETTPYEAASWIKVDPARQSAAPNAQVTFEARVTVPRDASPGSHLAALLFEGSAPTTPGAVSVRAQVTGLMLLRTPGDIVRKASVASFDTDRSLYQAQAVIFATRVRNEGNVHFKPDVTVEVKNLLGTKVATVKPKAQGNVLPNSIRRFDSEWKHPAKFGRYTAKATVKYPDANATYTASTSVWIMPTWRSLIVALGVALVLFFVFWVPRKRWKKAFKALTSD